MFSGEKNFNHFTQVKLFLLSLLSDNAEFKLKNEKINNTKNQLMLCLFELSGTMQVAFSSSSSAASKHLELPNRRQHLICLAAFYKA